MPAIFTHIQFGKEVAAALPPALQELAKEHAPAFYLGTQGPDILFYHKPLKSKQKNPSRKKGWDLHAEAPLSFFQRAKELATSPAEQAYLLGFLCHYSLDCFCHPYIDAHSVDGLTHGKIESELDKHIFMRAGKAPRGNNAAEYFFPCEEGQRAGAKILDVPEKDMLVAIKSMKKINGLFSSKRAWVHALCHFALTLAGMNNSFGEMFLHKRADERCTPLLPELESKFEEAIPTAVERITLLFEQNTLPEELYTKDYSGNEEEK